MHTPVLLKETIEILNPQPNEFFIDGTIGSGGHAEAILGKIGQNGKLLGIDWDENNIKKLIEIKKLRNWWNLILVHGNYADLPKIIKEKNLPKADGLLLDLGFSSETLESERGFSFQKDESLDMRYDAETSDKKPAFAKASAGRHETRITAADVVNKFSEKELADIFWKYGEEKFSRQIAKRIVESRKRQAIRTTFDLVKIIGGRSGRIPRRRTFGSLRGRHPATKVFQALRIYVNGELGNLEKLLKNLDKIIKTKPSSEISAGPPKKADKDEICRNSTAGTGRLAIISFHSLEDRLVKNSFKELEMRKKAQILTNPAGKPLASNGARKPFIKPSLEEILANPRARSAKLRALIMKHGI